VRIIEVRDNVFYAELILDQNTKVSARARVSEGRTASTAGRSSQVRGRRRLGAMLKPKDRWQDVVFSRRINGWAGFDRSRS